MAIRTQHSNSWPASRTPLAALSLAVLFMLVPFGTAAGHSYKAGTISIGHIWAKPTEAGQMLSVFGPIFNTGEQSDRLERVKAPGTSRAGVCAVTDSGALQWSDAVVLNPGKVVALAPWREHICLQGLERSLKADQSLEIELQFENAGTVDIEVLIEPEGSNH